VGTGKSSLIRQFLMQIRDRGETAIVYDPAREYLPQFYTEGRGDQILNPLDARCPYWTPADEVRRDEEALTIATALFPDRQGENKFFTEAPRRIFAYLLTLRLDGLRLAAVLKDEDELDRLLGVQIPKAPPVDKDKRTPYANFIDHGAPAQRSGVLSALNMVSDTLSMLPAVRDGHGLWSAADWAQHRNGWLFFTSGPDTRVRQIPLMTLWLDMLILRLMDASTLSTRKTWLVIDELASLKTLPQLATALTEIRKANVPMVLGFQARAQIEALYGKTAEAMMSQPATKIILRTSEPNSAKWLSDTIGQVEVERIKRSQSEGRKGSRSESLERGVEPLVLPSEIQIQPDRAGILKAGHLVTRVEFPYVTLPAKAEAFVARTADVVATLIPESVPSDAAFI
jgi:type IV secretory pathway TraG/TraD family ATPase VirD4